MLPWLVFYDEQLDRARPQLAGQLTVSGIVGGSASWGQIGYWVDQRLAGRGIIPTFTVRENLKMGTFARTGNGGSSAAQDPTQDLIEFFRR